MPTARTVHRPTVHQTKHHKNDGENDNDDEIEQNIVVIQKIILEL